MSTKLTHSSPTMNLESSQQPVGDSVVAIAKRYAGIMNSSEFATTLRQGNLPKSRYLCYISVMYPIVVGFNRTLIRSLQKLDHVRQWKLINALAEQLQDEQRHNQLWRKMLEAFGVDHVTLYSQLTDYLATFSSDELNLITHSAVDLLREDLNNVSPIPFTESHFPKPVLALYHYLWITASDPNVDYWEHFACQSVIENIIFDVVSESIYPGVSGHPALEKGAITLEWWLEHAKQGGAESGKLNDEEKHLRLAQITLNKSERAASIAPQILRTAENAARLFSATMLCHNIDRAPTSLGILQPSSDTYSEAETHTGT